jgi:hypothetical protein
MIERLDQAPEEIQEEVRADCLDSIKAFTAEMQSYYGAKFDELSDTAILEALELAVKERLKASRPKGNPQTEDPLDAEARREASIRRAITAARDILDMDADGSWEEQEYLLSQVLEHLARVVSMNAQKHLLSRAIQQQVSKNA